MTRKTLTLRKSSSRKPEQPKTTGFSITNKTPRQQPDIASATFAIERHSMIAEIAYYRAEKRGFLDGYEVTDWLAAEHEVDNRETTAAHPA
jgi:hypothetical protein